MRGEQNEGGEGVKRGRRGRKRKTNITHRPRQDQRCHPHVQKSLDSPLFWVYYLFQETRPSFKQRRLLIMWSSDIPLDQNDTDALSLNLGCLPMSSWTSLDYPSASLTLPAPGRVSPTNGNVMGRHFSFLLKTPKC